MPDRESSFAKCASGFEGHSEPLRTYPYQSGTGLRHSARLVGEERLNLTCGLVANVHQLFMMFRVIITPIGDCCIDLAPCLDLNALVAEQNGGGLFSDEQIVWHG